MIHTLEVRRGMTEGVQIDGQVVVRVESYQICEDHKTLMVMLELRNGEMACYTFAPGEPIVAHIVGRCSDLSPSR